MAQVNKVVAGSETKATTSDAGGQDGSITIEEEFQVTRNPKIQTPNPKP
jgi:hypothetical protein